jgi:hypothetical protein
VKFRAVFLFSVIYKDDVHFNTRFCME